MSGQTGLIELRVLGALDLRTGDGTPIQSVIAQPKRTALLLYLALARPRGMHRRETLAGLFWAEMDGERARKALRQALYYLRGSLGEDALVTIGDAEVGITRERVWCDAVEMERGLDEDRAEDAIALYAGELLPGFYVEDAPGFERWLEEERDRLRRLAARAAWRVAEKCEAAGDARGASEWGRKAVGLSPGDETEIRRLMELLERLGDRASAIRAYEAFAWRLEQEYELEPSADTRALADSIRHRRQPANPTVHASDPAPAVDTAPEEIRDRTEPMDVASDRPPPRKRFPVRTVVLVLVAASGLYAWRESASSRSTTDAASQPPDPAVLVVLPFRVPTADSALALLEEGMVDLLATRLASDGEARVVTARTAIAEWRRSRAAGSADLNEQSAVAIAARLGAGHAVLGNVILAIDELTLVASLVSVPDGRVRARAEVSGPTDSLIVLVDRLAVELLGAEIGMREDRLAYLTSTSLPAVRSYLAGLSAYRRGATDTAGIRFERAVQYDSTFGLAALGLSVSLDMGWTRYPAEMRARAKALAWAGRERMTPRDRLRLLSHLGPRYPDWTAPAEYIDFLESTVEQTRDDPELWFALGNALFLAGGHLAIPNWRESAGAALRRAIQLDSVHPGPRGFLLRLEIDARDTVAVRELAELSHARPGWDRDMFPWHHEALSQGGFSAQPTRFPLEELGEHQLRRVVIESGSFGIAVADAERALSILLERAAGRAERDRTLMLARELRLNLGRPGDATRVLDELQKPGRSVAFVRERVREAVYYALYWDGDRAAGAAAAAQLALTSGEPLAADPASRTEQMRDLCTIEQWRLASGVTETAVQSIARLRAAAATSGRQEAVRIRSCAALLAATIASRSRRTEFGEALDRLDSLHVAALPDLGNEDIWIEAGNLVIARLRESNGDFHGALRTLRRRGEPSDQKILLSSLLREEGRIAAMTGDTAGAVRAYRHYLVLRSNPEPHLRAHAASVASELESLLQHGKGSVASSK